MQCQKSYTLVERRDDALKRTHNAHTSHLRQERKREPPPQQPLHQTTPSCIKRHGLVERGMIRQRLRPSTVLQARARGGGTLNANQHNTHSLPSSHIDQETLRTKRQPLLSTYTKIGMHIKNTKHKTLTNLTTSRLHHPHNPSTPHILCAVETRGWCCTYV
ncbi:hypothetical protein BDQ17DRAFT_109039 [Cyathus striatus]|nr:hypothetical protein BDQ17DRAFT_109039 [Cyathus striatus]